MRLATRPRKTNLTLSRRSVTRTLPAGAGRPKIAIGNATLEAARTCAQREIREQMIALQEELDWRCYRLYDVTADDLCTCLRGNAPRDPPR